MFCKECGKEIPNNAKFCPVCGSSQAVRNVQTRSPPGIQAAAEVHESPVAIALYVVALLFFFVAAYYFGNFEEMCDPSIWVPDDCDDERQIMFGSLFIAIICFAGGMYLTNKDPRNKF